MDPQLYMLGIFRYQIRLQQAIKPPETSRYFFFWEKLSDVFQTDPYTLTVYLEIFSPKNRSSYWKTYLAQASAAWILYKRNEAKKQKGEAKNAKVC